MRFPPRTIALMIAALMAFAWFYWNTHKAPRRAQAPPLPPQVQEIQVVPMGGDH